jgi:DNA-directed RNA polymerase beta subunit
LPEWTKVYVNSDLWAVCIGNTEDLHANLLAARRSGVFADSVSLAWMRINNEYRIACDAGRPVRPVYRPGTTPEVIKAAKTWKDILANLDYIDAAESDSLRISMVPYHPTLPSELHMTFNMSALANMVPYSDHNPGTRSVFSIAQQKAAAGWYHTNYMKRFDTIAEFLTLPRDDGTGWLPPLRRECPGGHHNVRRQQPGGLDADEWGLTEAGHVQDHVLPLLRPCGGRRGLARE